VGDGMEELVKALRDLHSKFRSDEYRPFRDLLKKAQETGDPGAHMVTRFIEDPPPSLPLGHVKSPQEIMIKGLEVELNMKKTAIAHSGEEAYKHIRELEQDYDRKIVGIKLGQSDKKKAKQRLSPEVPVPVSEGLDVMDQSDCTEIESDEPHRDVDPPILGAGEDKEKTSVEVISRDPKVIYGNGWMIYFDFRTGTVDRKHFTLSSRQSEIVRMVYEAPNHRLHKDTIFFEVLRSSTTKSVKAWTNAWQKDNRWLRDILFLLPDYSGVAKLNI
jgi:hypothetical protein